MNTFEQILRNRMIELRADFAAHNLSRMSVEITVSGPADYSSLEIQFSVGTSNYGERVLGNSLDACFSELLRRKGWQERNAPIAIPYLRTEEEEDNEEGRAGFREDD